MILTAQELINFCEDCNYNPGNVFFELNASEDLAQYANNFLSKFKINVDGSIVSLILRSGEIYSFYKDNAVSKIRDTLIHKGIDFNRIELESIINGDNNVNT